MLAVDGDRVREITALLGRMCEGSEIGSLPNLFPRFGLPAKLAAQALTLREPGQLRCHPPRQANGHPGSERGPSPFGPQRKPKFRRA
jgi:hypothetical protein